MGGRQCLVDTPRSYSVLHANGVDTKSGISQGRVGLHVFMGDHGSLFAGRMFCYVHVFPNNVFTLVIPSTASGTLNSGSIVHWPRPWAMLIVRDELVSYGEIMVI
jgi:hypothetical protein